MMAIEEKVRENELDLIHKQMDIPIQEDIATKFDILPALKDGYSYS